MNGLSRTVLYLTRYYIPTATAAGIRADRFVKALTNSGVRVIVATIGADPEYQEISGLLTICRIARDGRLPGRLPDNLPVWPRLEPLPGPHADPICTRALYRACHGLIRQYQPDILFATGLPFSLLAAAQRLAKMYGLKLALEFRDAWTVGKDWPYPSAFHRRLARKWEDRCITHAELIITETDHQKKILDDHYGCEISPRTLTIRHSFERAEEIDSDVRLNPDEFTIVYTGQLRGLDITESPALTKVTKVISRMIRRVLLGATFCDQLRLDWMSPDYLMAGLARAVSKNQQFAHKVRLIFAGQKFPEIDHLARKYNITGNVTQLGPVSPPYAQQLAHLADVRVLTLYGINNLDYHWCVPGKTYAYMGSGKPILALLPTGEARDLVTGAGTGVFAKPDDIPEIARQLLVLFQRRITNQPALEPDWSFINQFHLPVQQRQFVQALAKLAGWPLQSTPPSETEVISRLHKLG
ncbi:MAG: glycosyltransferase [Sedimentisphaerales bacterium]|nr:glycosyltransferase [Sedimentisphaerales bacterium]